MHRYQIMQHHVIACRPSQGEELEPARRKAEQFGVKDIFIDDLREEFVRDYVFPMFRCVLRHNINPSSGCVRVTSSVKHGNEKSHQVTIILVVVIDLE